jgi:hypothetical protein
MPVTRSAKAGGELELDTLSQFISEGVTRRMKSKTNHRSIAVWLLITLQFLLGLGAFVSGGMLVAAPDGALMHMPLSILQYSPFANFLIPGIILALLLGLYPMAVAYCLWRNPAWRWPDGLNPFKQMHWSWAASLSTGVILLVWITVQVLFLRSVAFLHALYFGWGWALIILTLTPGVRKGYTR